MEEELKEKLFNKKDNGWDSLDSNQKEEVFDLSKKYMDFLLSKVGLQIMMLLCLQNMTLVS